MATASVILPTHCSGTFVSRAIDSVLGQHGHHVRELIVIDDCSPDDTADVIRSRYGGDSRVKLLSTERNMGPGAARNAGIDAATGEWIALIDADDAWVPDRLSRLMPMCTADTDMLFDNLIVFDQRAGRPTGTMFASLPDDMDVVAMVGDRIAGSKFNYGYLKPLVRRAFLERAGVAYPAIRISEDLLFYLELLVRRPQTRVSNIAGYIYTAPVGGRSRRRSSWSKSEPDDLLVAQMLEELRRRHENRLTPVEIEAISRRADGLRQSAPLTRLYDSRTRRRYLSVVGVLLTDSRARRAFVSKLRQKFR